ncbi:MAG: Rid family detoxifying hydrolase [Kiritimatiellae bacterium]|nr:Rid family detoxifying hydrolase [Kiritimatiellia bacterium]
MSKIVIKTSGAPKAVARYSQGIKVGNTLYVQGVIALDPPTGKLVAGAIEPQTERVLASLKAIVEASGMTLADVVKVTAFLANLEDYPKFNEIYGRHFNAEPPPVRTTVQAKLPLGALVEIEVIAARE